MTKTIQRTALARLLELIGGDVADLDELTGEFIGSAPELAARISTAAERRDFDAMRVAAHTLKSNARDFGAARLSESAALIESACKSGDVQRALERASRIKAEEWEARTALTLIREERFVELS